MLRLGNVRSGGTFSRDETNVRGGGPFRGRDARLGGSPGRKDRAGSPHRGPLLLDLGWAHAGKPLSARVKRTARLGLFLLLAAGCAAHRPPATTAPGAPEATSLLGRPLHAPPLTAEARARLEANLAEARTAYDAAPHDVERAIWLGRRTAYLGRYREAIAVYTKALEQHPDEPRLLRHRGHRFITVREFDAAVRDLTRAAEVVEGRPDEVEPDGAPNRFNIPTSTLQGNIWYHLALAHYLKGDFEKALAGWQQAMKRTTNDDTLVANSDWLYMTLRRLGRTEEAARVLEPIHAGLKILENEAYHRRLLMYRGERTAESLLHGDGDAVLVATQGYGVGNWYLYNGQTDRARAIFQRVIEGPNWSAFGFIAAEAELARSR